MYVSSMISSYLRMLSTCFNSIDSSWGGLFVAQKPSDLRSDSSTRPREIVLGWWLKYAVIYDTKVKPLCNMYV